MWESALTIVDLLGGELDFEGLCEVLEGGVQLSAALVEAAKVVESHGTQLHPHLVVQDVARGGGEDLGLLEELVGQHVVVCAGTQ